MLKNEKGTTRKSRVLGQDGSTTLRACTRKRKAIQPEQELATASKKSEHIYLGEVWQAADAVAFALDQVRSFTGD